MNREAFRYIIAVVLAAFLAAFAHADMQDVKEEENATERVLAKNEAIELKAVMNVPEETCYYDVPLDYEFQDYVIELCQAHKIEPGVVFAIMERESNFRDDAIGDNGKSFGIMQIQRKWHEDRMERLGVTDLMDKYQNVLVGVDYLFELFERENGVEWALCAYNAGPSGANAGRGGNYAEQILLRSDELTEGMIGNDVDG